MRLRVQIPQVDPDHYAAPPERCPECGNTTWHSHGWVDKALRDTKLDQVCAHRLQCTDCGQTVRVYPQGVTQRSQSERLRGLSVLLWLLGLSYRAVSDVAKALAACRRDGPRAISGACGPSKSGVRAVFSDSLPGCPLGHTTVYNNVQQTGEKARGLKEKRLGKDRVRVLAADCTHVQVQGQDTVVLQLADGEHGNCLVMEVVDGENAESLLETIAEVAKAVGAEVLLTDDADPLKAVSDQVDVDQQICQQHAVPNTLRKLAEIAEQLEKMLERKGGGRSRQD